MMMQQSTMNHSSKMKGKRRRSCLTVRETRETSSRLSCRIWMLEMFLMVFLLELPCIQSFTLIQTTTSTRKRTIADHSHVHSHGSGSSGGPLFSAQGRTDEDPSQNNQDQKQQQQQQQQLHDHASRYSVGICGAGAIALGTAALLTQAGHDPMIWSSSSSSEQKDNNQFSQEHQDSTVTATFPHHENDNDNVDFQFQPRIARSCSELLHNNEIIFLALPANGHKTILDQLVPLLDPHKHKAVIISSHSSLGALYLSNQLYEYHQQKKNSDTQKRIPIYAWGTTVCTARRGESNPQQQQQQHHHHHHVRLNTIRRQVDWCTVPAATTTSSSNKDDTHHSQSTTSTSIPKEQHLLHTLFPQIAAFPHRQNILAISLSNLNPQNHLGIALGNMSRMEKHEQWYQLLHVTPNIGRYLEALDRERLCICQALGVTTKTIFEHFRDGFGVPETDSISEMNQEIYRQGKDVHGPSTADSRYVLEDVPFGLALTVQLGDMVGQPAVLHEAGLRTMSAMYGRDFAHENDLLNALQIQQYSLDELQEAAVSGILPFKKKETENEISWQNERPERTMVG